MKKSRFLIVLLSIMLACNKDYNKNKQPYQFIPKDINSVIKINELNDFNSSVKNQNLLSTIYNKELKSTSKVLSHLNTSKQVYIAFSKTSENNSEYTILTENDSTLFVLDSIPNLISETLRNFKIEKTQIDSITIYHKVIGKVFIATSDLEILKQINLKEENLELSKLIKTTDDKSIASIIFDSNSSNYSKLLFKTFDNPTAHKQFTVLDFNSLSNNLQYNGIQTFKDSISNYLDSFKNTIPQKTKTIEIAPNTTKSLLSVAFDDFLVWNNNLNEIKQQDLDNTNTYLNFSDEIALIDNAVVLHTLDPNLIIESIEDKSNSETFRDIEIYETTNSDFFKSRLQPFLTYENANFFSAYENFILFSDSKETIKSILSNALNGNTLSNSDAYINISEQLSDEASLFIYKNSDALTDLLNESAKGYNANVVQYIYEDNYAHINGVIKKFEKKAASQSITEAFTTKLDADIISPPQAVKNHITDAHDIAAQDVNNTLYLISNTGNILWKKQLQGKILGQIEQIDIYKNGRLQLAFATTNRIYVLDRNGNDVSPFPMKFNDAITQPLSVFDYDKRKDYRLLVTQGKNLLMYDTKGKSVSGFNYKNNGSQISTQPKHFRIGSKDYIAFAAGKNLKILNRQGNTRITVKDKIQFSDNALYLYQNKFTTTNMFGQQIQVDTKGKLSTKNLNLSEKHKIETTSKTFVSMTENKLNIKSRTVDLDYGEYTAPKIFYLNDKIYVSTTDLKSKKVYLFDSQAKSIANFPVFGTSAAELQELDKDRGLELITQSDSKTLIVYKIH